MARWWNAVVEIMVPFDTEEEARNAFTNNETIEAVIAIFGPPRHHELPCGRGRRGRLAALAVEGPSDVE